MFDALSALLQAVADAAFAVVEGWSYVVYVLLNSIISFLDFDPFDELIDQYNPATLIGDEWVHALAFVCHWLPIADCTVFITLFFGILGACVLFRMLYNWLKIASSGGGD